MFVRAVCGSLTMSRRRKLLVYLCLATLLGYLSIHVMYFNDTYSPLKVLADARSEAKRLLRFMTLYHYQCNNTLTMSNATNWPVCTEVDGGINPESKPDKIIYSIGPTDYDFENMIARNMSSSSVHIFTHASSPRNDFLLPKQNNTHLYRTVIVPNDPADFTRNSFHTQTLNSVMDTLHHKHIDILKIEQQVDLVSSYELLYYLVKDGLLKRISQLHFSIVIDKIDDDFLYGWYRTLYNLFHEAGFRLYHTATSNQLCLQVTLMESCVYYMSWIHSPSPRMFVMYPPAVDGTYEYELRRFEDHLQGQTVDCYMPTEVTISDKRKMTICKQIREDQVKRPCKLVIVRTKLTEVSVTSETRFDCQIVVVQGTDLGMDGEVTVFNLNQQGTAVTNVQTIPLTDALLHHLKATSYNIFYTDTSGEFWELISLMMDDGLMQVVDQFIADIELWAHLNQGNIRRGYSEIMRLKAYGFDLFRYVNLSEDDTLRFRSANSPDKTCCQRLSYLRTKVPRMGK